MQYDHLPILEGRLHPVTVVFAIYNSIRNLIIPAVSLLLIESRTVTITLVLLMVTGVIARALVRYFTFSYRIEGGELITRQGILERRERHIPLERVQEIRLEQGVLHRIFGVVDASIETAGGQGPEASLSVLSHSEAERLRQAVFARMPSRTIDAARGLDAPQAAVQRVVLRRLRLHDLILHGLTSNVLLSALAFVGALWAFVDDILPGNFYERVADAIYRETHRLLKQGAQTALFVAMLSILLLLLASLLLSIIGSIVRFYGFTLSQIGEDLHRSYGLLTQRSSSLPRRRIQVLEIREGALRRLLRLAALRVDTAGDRSSDPKQKNEGRDVLLPIALRKGIDDLLPVIFPDIEPAPVSWRRASRLAILRGAIKGGLVCAMAAAAVSWHQQGLFWLWMLLLLPLIYIINVMRYNNLGYTLGERYFRTRRGWLGRSTHIVPIRNAQAIVAEQSPLDRRLGLATLIVDTAGQTYTGGGPKISNLPLEEAQSLARTLAHRAAATRYRW